MIKPVLGNSNVPRLAGPSGLPCADQGSEALECHHGENSDRSKNPSWSQQGPETTATTATSWREQRDDAILPDIKYSARALRCATSPTSRPALLVPGEKVGVYGHGKQSATGAVLARVMFVDSFTNTVKVQLPNGEQKDLPASSTFDRKLMKLVTGGSRSKSEERSKKSVHLPKMQQSPRSNEVSSSSWFPGSARRASGELSASQNTTTSNFNHGHLSSAQTLGEVHLLLSRPDARVGPPCDAKSFKNALLKKFDRIEWAWEEIDTNGDCLIDFIEFTRACRKIQFAGNLKKIFKELTHGEDKLRPELLDTNLPAKLKKVELEKSPKKMSPRRKSAQDDALIPPADFNHGMMTSATTLGEVHKLLQRPSARSGPACDAKHFKHALRKKFGKLVHAWVEIDSNGDGNLQYHEFIRACRNIQFVGNFKKIFQELTCGEDNLRPELLDAQLPAELQQLKRREEEQIQREQQSQQLLKSNSREQLLKSNSREQLLKSNSREQLLKSSSEEQLLKSSAGGDQPVKT